MVMETINYYGNFTHLLKMIGFPKCMLEATTLVFSCLMTNRWIEMKTWTSKHSFKASSLLMETSLTQFMSMANTANEEDSVTRAICIVCKLYKVKIMGEMFHYCEPTGL